MSVESERLRDEARQLRALAEQLDEVPAAPRRTAEGIPWRGPAADRVRGDAFMWAGRFSGVADALLAEAKQRENEAQQAEQRQRAGMPGS